MHKFLINWLVNALALPITARILEQFMAGGFRIRDFLTGAIAALTLGAINSFVRPLLKILTFPLTILTLGLSSFAINVLCLVAVSLYVPGFEIRGPIPAIVGSIILSIVATMLHWVFGE